MPTDATEAQHRADSIDDLDTLVETYLSLWNEPDAEVRRDLIRRLWTPEGDEILVDPPQEIRDAADSLAFPTPPLEVHGYDALEARVTRAYEMFIAPGEYAFRARGPAVRLIDGVVSFAWDMVSRADGEVAGGGLNVLALTAEGRIRSDYQFIEGSRR